MARPRKWDRQYKKFKEKHYFVKQLVIGFLVLLTLTLILLGIWHGSRVESLTIREVEVLGGKTISHDTVREIVNRELSGGYLKLIPKRFSLTYPREAIVDALFRVDRIKNVRVERITWVTLGVVFEEYEPVALWCQENRLTEECLFLDKNGFAFSEAPPLEGAAFVRYSESERELAKGEYLFDGEYIEATNTFIEDAYSELGLNIVYVERTRQDEVSYELAGGGEIKTSLRMSTDDTLRNLETILLSEEFDHIAPGNFQYIDLRFGNKIFVNEELEPVATTTEESVEGEEGTEEESATTTSARESTGNDF